MALRPKEGDLIAGYRIERRLGEGGMGSVFLGVHDGGIRRAIKVPAADASPEERERFLREAQALEKLGPHPNVVRVHAAGRDGSFSYCVLDWIEGRSLEQLVREEGPLPWRRAFELGEQVARGLAHVHAGGLVHRDVKPANVLVRASDGVAVLADFGLALDLARERLTQSGTTLGTPSYMSPEQAAGKKDLDARSDVWSLGATLYAAIVGAPPFEGGTIHVLRAIVESDAAPPSKRRRGLPPVVDEVITRALSRDRDRRLASDALAHELARARRESARGRHAVPMFVVATLVAGGGVALARQGPSAPGSAPAAPAPAPRAVDALDEVGSLLSSGRARDALERVVRLPGSDRARVLRARALEAVLPPDVSAQAAMDLVVRELKHCPEAARAIFLALAGRGDPEVAATVLEGVLERDKQSLEVLEVPSSLSSVLERRLADAEGRDWRVGLRRYAMAIAADPSVPVPTKLLFALMQETLRNPSALARFQVEIEAARVGLRLPYKGGSEDARREPPSVAAHWTEALVAIERVLEDVRTRPPHEPEALRKCVEVARELEKSPKLPLAARLLARHAGARALVRLREREAGFEALERLMAESPEPDECAGIVVASYLDALVYDQPRVLSADRAAKLAKRAIDLAEDRIDRTALGEGALREGRERRLPALWPLTADSTHARIAGRWGELALIELAAGNDAEALELARRARQLSKSGKEGLDAWLLPLALAHAFRGEEAELRAVFSQVAALRDVSAQDVRRQLREGARWSSARRGRGEAERMDALLSGLHRGER